ncbi:SPRY-domain-containing protein [Basidiobolus meristosporus CBS 931.73]|uniref:SPRY-domain-containing protein n=1 Tax=Basidiobolus meristosporus CBS 931.73 TaxID=1314790 RepID=A0A1Y1Z9T3_9FUNG|nr:SPRY-domain-containing protein [Basidiobolus meristosporus CBS 931.73]|eukprot:ORY06956.1 SPRY-domain-containing protein [Basidiobolus meristosporus CBS 931.73]
MSQEESEFIKIVLTMVEILDHSDPLSSAFLCHILELAALPSIKTVLKVNACLLRKIHSKMPFHHKLKQRYRLNASIVWCVLAERLAGEASVYMFTEKVHRTLLEGLQKNQAQRIQLLSLITLEKFALTGENKRKILNSDALNLIQSLVPPSSASDSYQMSELKLCTPWALKCSFSSPSNPTSLKEDIEISVLDSINVTLNWCDATSRLKWSPTGLEVRNDSTSFESVRGTMCVSKGCWYYEVHIITAGIMQIGWATKHSLFRPEEGIGVGDDEHSFAFDGCRKLAWSSGHPISYGRGDSWNEGDVLGVYLDMEYGVIRFYLNGHDLGIAFEFTGHQLAHFIHNEGGFYPALSLTSFQHVILNFGQQSFKYPPVQMYHNFDQEGKLPENLRLQSVYSQPAMLNLTDSSPSETSCSICCDGEATVQLDPCGHSGFCSQCATLFQNCPLCRGPVYLRVSSTSPSQHKIKG